MTDAGLGLPAGFQAARERALIHVLPSETVKELVDHELEALALLIFSDGNSDGQRGVLLVELNAEGKRLVVYVNHAVTVNIAS